MTIDMKRIFCFVVGFVAAVGAQEQCRTPNGDAGSCILLETCDPLKEINAKEKKTSDDLLFLRQSGCGLHMNIKPKVCCPPKNQWGRYTTIRPSTWPTVSKVTKRPATQQPPVFTPPTVHNTNSTLPDVFNTVGGPDLPKPLGGEDLFPEYETNCKPSIKPPAPDSFCCGIEAASTERIIGDNMSLRVLRSPELTKPLGGENLLTEYETNRDLLPNILERMIGGKNAAIDQFPWLALLEFNSTGNGQKTPCGGTLISSRYVLTAAHCLGATIWGTAYQVRLAEYNTSSYPTDVVSTPGGGSEFITVLIIPIERQIPHPNYKRYSATFTDDIGLVKLARHAPYTDFIRPICLPIRDITTMPEAEDLCFFSAGWGSDGSKYTAVKQQITLPYVPLSQCQIPYAKHKTPITLQKTHLCAGGEKDRDTCGGDSGGPLMYEAGDTFILVGVVSFGNAVCGTDGTPGVYTNVYEYLSWIVKSMV